MTAEETFEAMKRICGDTLWTDAGGVDATTMAFRALSLVARFYQDINHPDELQWRRIATDGLYREQERVA